MKLLALLFITLLSMNTEAKETIIEGVIASYDCGDNCYLTIIDKNKKQRVGLCSATACQSWNEKVFMPAKFKGKKVRVRVSQGVQYDGAGNVMGEMDAFAGIEWQ
jgi:hypothetical protein